MVEALLYDVITVQILDETDNVRGQRQFDGLDLIAINPRVAIGGISATNLLTSRNELDHLLQGTSTVLVQRDLDHVRSGIVDEDCALLIIAVFKQLLAEIVTERI